MLQCVFFFFFFFWNIFAKCWVYMPIHHNACVSYICIDAAIYLVIHVKYVYSCPSHIIHAIDFMCGIYMCKHVPLLISVLFGNT